MRQLIALDTSNLRWHLASFFAIVAFSTIESASKLLTDGASPYAITAWRFFIGGLLLLPFALAQVRQSGQRPTVRVLARMALLGALTVCVSMLLLQLSVHYGKASVSAVLVSSNPLFVSVFALLILGEKLNWAQISGLILAVMGIGLLIANEADLAASRYLNLSLSIVLGIAAALTFGLYTVLAKRIIQTHGNALTNSVSFLGGSMALFILGSVTGRSMFIAPTGLNLGIMLYLGTVVSGVAYLAFFLGMEKLGAHRASMYFFLKPVIASLLAVALVGERLVPLQGLAIGIIIAGLALSRSRARILVRGGSRDSQATL